MPKLTEERFEGKKVEKPMRDINGRLTKVMAPGYETKYDRYGNIGPKQSNSKKQEDYDLYKTKLNYKINASKVVRLKNLPNGAPNLSIIATQWPLDNPEAINAFWDMVCNQGEVKTVVCLADPSTGKKEQPPYWAPKGKSADGIASPYNKGGCYEKACYKVTKCTKKDTIGQDVEKFELIVERFKEKEENGVVTYETEKKYRVDFYKYVTGNWPDQQLPNNPKQFETFVKHLDEKGISKLVVHCSAGVGRTGTLCACLYALRAKQDDALGIIKDLRNYRTSMVQNKDQFDFVQKFIFKNTTTDKKHADAFKKLKWTDPLAKYFETEDEKDVQYTPLGIRSQTKEEKAAVEASRTDEQKLEAAFKKNIRILDNKYNKIQQLMGKITINHKPATLEDLKKYCDKIRLTLPYNVQIKKDSSKKDARVIYYYTKKPSDQDFFSFTKKDKSSYLWCIKQRFAEGGWYEGTNVNEYIKGRLQTRFNFISDKLDDLLDRVEEAEFNIRTKGMDIKKSIYESVNDFNGQK